MHCRRSKLLLYNFETSWHEDRDCFIVLKWQRQPRGVQLWWELVNYVHLKFAVYSEKHLEFHSLVNKLRLKSLEYSESFDHCGRLISLAPVHIIYAVDDHEGSDLEVVFLLQLGLVEGLQQWQVLRDVSDPEGLDNRVEEQLKDWDALSSCHIRDLQLYWDYCQTIYAGVINI